MKKQSSGKNFPLVIALMSVILFSHIAQLANAQKANGTVNTDAKIILPDDALKVEGHHYYCQCQVYGYGCKGIYACLRYCSSVCHPSFLPGITSDSISQAPNNLINLFETERQK